MGWCSWSLEGPGGRTIAHTRDTEQLKSTYDYIVIDCPPVGLISDYHALNVTIDLTLFVVKQHYSLVKSLTAIDSHHLTNPEVVFNGVKEGFLKKSDFRRAAAADGCDGGFDHELRWRSSGYHNAPGSDRCRRYGDVYHVGC